MKQQQKQKGPAGAEAGRASAAVGPDNAGDAIMLKPQLAADIAVKQSRKRQAEGSTQAELAQCAVDGQQEAMQLDTRDAEGDGELTLEQRVNALQIQQQPLSQGQHTLLSHVKSSCGYCKVLYIRRCIKPCLTAFMHDRPGCSRLSSSAASCTHLGIVVAASVYMQQVLTTWNVCLAEVEAVEAGKLSSKAGSVVVLLSQALRSDDKQLLEKCFSMSNEKVVKATVQQLAPQDAARLLQVAVQRLQSSPARGKQIAVWLRAVLMHHTAYLITAPGHSLLLITAHNAGLAEYCHPQIVVDIMYRIVGLPLLT